MNDKRNRYPKLFINWDFATGAELTLQSLLNSPTLAVKMPQDMPPTGGYDAVQYRRNLPARGFRPAYGLVAVGAVMTYGFWRVGQGIREHK